MKQWTSEKLQLFDLIQRYAYQYRETSFILASGKTSNHYFNCKNITLYPERLKVLTDYLVSFHIPSLNISDREPLGIGGLTMGSDPICYSVSSSFHMINKPMFPLIVRKKTKSHGMNTMVEGAIDHIKEALIVDDVITTGGSTMQAIEAISNLGIKIRKGFCIIDREEGGCQNIKKDTGIDIFPIFKKSDFFKK